MDTEKTISHWQFAKAWAIYGLERIILHFDFDEKAGHHAYAGMMSPDELLQTIDAFLAESDEVVWGGERTTLFKLRQIVNDKIAVAFELGTKSARENFRDLKVEYGEILTEDVKNTAWKLAPADEIERNWFVEAYCRAWANEELNSLRHEINSKVSLQSDR
jgi:hypothetical protein